MYRQLRKRLETRKSEEREEKFLWRRIKVTNKLERLYNYHQPPVKPLLVKIPALKCPRCGYYWIPKKKFPKICPSCNSRLLKEYEEAGDITIKVESEGVDKGKLEGIREELGKMRRSIEILEGRYDKNSDIIITLKALRISLERVEKALEEL